MFFKGRMKYAGYLLFSRHSRGHGIHSPFVFNLISGVLRNKIDRDVVILIENIRQKLLSDKTPLIMVDMGAGSQVSKSSVRKVCDIAKYSSIPSKYGILLSNLASRFGKSGIIEYGTALGISTMYLASGRTDSLVCTMEGCPAVSAIATENFRTGGFKNIINITGSFENSIPGIKNKIHTPGLIFIDGNHRKEALLRYFTEMSEISVDETVIAIDDIHLSKEMEEAWIEIQQSDKISFTIDLFRMGLVFFRKGMSRLHYVIRY